MPTINIRRTDFFYLEVLRPHYGNTKSEIMTRLINDFIENHRGELEKGPCRERLKIFEEKLVKQTKIELLIPISQTGRQWS